MRDNIIKYVLIVSLLLNFSMLGAAGYTHYKGKAAPHGMSSGCPDAHANHVFTQLSLNPSLRDAMQKKASAFHAALGGKRQEVLAKKAVLVGLMRAEAPDDKAIGGAISQINGEQEEMQKMIVAHILEFKGMLDRKQQQKFLDLIDEAMTGKSEVQCP